ncbi:MAG: hypothetical protein ACOCQE_03305 [Halanaerobium sp.]
MISLFDKYVSVSIPAENRLKNVVAKYNENEIQFIEGINLVDSIGRIKKLDYNCQYIILLPAEKIYFKSISVAPLADFRISEDSFLSELKEEKINFKEDYYYDYLESRSKVKEESELKFFAADKPMLDQITEKLDKNRNNYLVSALPVVVYSIVNELIEEENYLFYYQIDDKYTLITVENNHLELLKPCVDKVELQFELEKIQKYYLNNKSLKLNVIEGNSSILNMDKFIELEEDDFVFLTSVLWSVSKC